MKKIIEFFKNLFRKNQQLAIDSAKINNNYIIEKEKFLNSITVQDVDNSVVLQLQLEQGLIDESQLNNEQINKIKELYCNQVIHLINSINIYKTKLNKN